MYVRTSNMYVCTIVHVKRSKKFPTPHLTQFNSTWHHPAVIVVALFQIP